MVDKKNTILLTVIAVATLLVAVVGATFAYFSVVGNNNSNPTVITSSIDKVGTVVLTSPNFALNINLTSKDMDQKLGGSASFYSVLPGSKENYLTSPENALQQVLLATVYDENIENSYECLATVKIGLQAINNKTLDSLIEGDGEIVFGGALEGTKVNLSDIKTGNKHELLIENVKFTGLKYGTTKDITAYLVIHNTEVPQDYLQNEVLTISITAPEFVCEKVNNGF